MKVSDNKCWLACGGESLFNVAQSSLEKSRIDAQEISSQISIVSPSISVNFFQDGDLLIRRGVIQVSDGQFQRCRYIGLLHFDNCTMDVIQSKELYEYSLNFLVQNIKFSSPDTSEFGSCEGNS
jgi:hypothetical protein